PPTSRYPKPIALPGPEPLCCVGAAAVRVVSDCRTIAWSGDQGRGVWRGAAYARRVRPRVVRCRFGKCSVPCCNGQAGGQKWPARFGGAGIRGAGAPSSDVIGTTPRTAFVSERLVHGARPQAAS